MTHVTTFMNINDPFLLNPNDETLHGQNERFGRHRKSAVRVIIAGKDNEINETGRNLFF